MFCTDGLYCDRLIGCVLFWDVETGEKGALSVPRFLFQSLGAVAPSVCCVFVCVCVCVCVCLCLCLCLRDDAVCNYQCGAGRQGKEGSFQTVLGTSIFGAVSYFLGACARLSCCTI